MKNRMFVLSLLIAVGFFVAADSARADSISAVSFTTLGSWNGDSYKDETTKTFSAGNSDNGFKATFDGVVHNLVALPEDSISLGTFEFTNIEGNGATAHGSFYLEILQTLPDGGPAYLVSTLSGRIGTGNDLFTVDFTGSTSTVINGIDGAVEYELTSPTFTATRKPNGSFEGFTIYARIMDPPLGEAPEPASLVLLGTGIAGIGLIRWRRGKH